jgi:5-methylcytosine-specific restriction endonuclease McrA
MATSIDDSGTVGKICHVCTAWKPLTEYSSKRVRGLPVGDGYHNICKKCRSATERARYHANPEPYRAANRARHHANRDRYLEAQRAYRIANHERIIAQKRDHWAANHDEINAERRARRAADPGRKRPADLAYYRTHRAKKLAYAKAYRAAHRDKIRAYNRAYYPTHYRQHYIKYWEAANHRRAVKLQAEGSHTETEWEALKSQYGYTCLCCHQKESHIILTRDHIIPLSRGGSDWITNIQPLCFSCNRIKSTDSIDYRSSWSTAPPIIEARAGR